jgi:urease accessory protein
MLRATVIEPPGPATDEVVLDHDHRHRRRLRLVTAAGRELLLDLPQARLLRDGEVLVAEDGQRIAVRAAAEEVMEIACADPAGLLRVAWHLGNRHTPAQILGDRLRIRRDHVLAAMLEGLGARVVMTVAPFDPEGGAYGHRHDH